MSRAKKPANPFRYFHSSPEVIRLVVMMYVRFPLSLRNVEDLLSERGIDICHETVRLWWNRFGGTVRRIVPLANCGAQGRRSGCPEPRNQQTRSGISILRRR